jgi:hypothetical protein
MAVYGTIGSVSSATHREEDLIPTFISTLEDLVEKLSLEAKGKELETVAEVSRVTQVIAEIEGRMYDESGEVNEDYWESEDASHDLNETLFNELNRFAPPYCYFGANEGDGADFGFWVSQETIDEAGYEGDLVKCSELPEKYDPQKSYLVVSDHGNMSLYQEQERPEGNGLVEVWSIV